LSEPLTPTPTAVSVASQLLREAATEYVQGSESSAWSLLMSDDYRDDYAALAELRSLSWIARIYLDRNPLIKRAQRLRTFYVWGTGVQVSVRVPDGGDTAVNDVLQAFLDDDSNADALTSSDAHRVNEAGLGTDGNVYLALFTNPVTGRVQVRRIPFHQIEDTVRNPDDASEVWFYRRVHYAAPVGAGPQRRVITYHPAMKYRPTLRPKSWGVDQDRGPILWDAPLRHVADNRQSGRLWGVGDLHAALPWARAYTVFLEDWARLAKALSQFAWKASAPSQSKATQMAAELLAAQDTGVGRLDGGLRRWDASSGVSAGAAVMTPGMDLAPIPKTGATIDADSGKPLAAMVAASTDLPLTMLLGDPGTTGARAVAETLDEPTRLMAETRRELWTTVYKDICGYVIDQAVKAPRGPLSGTVRIDPYTGQQRIDLAGALDRTVVVDWPDLDDTPVSVLVAAIVAADSTGALPPEVVCEMLLRALGVPDVDEVMAAMRDEQGNFTPPAAALQAVAAQQDQNGAPGSQAAEAYRSTS
jgi:hypothetical protein